MTRTGQTMPLVWALLLASCLRPNPGFGTGSSDAETTPTSTETTVVTTTNVSTSGEVSESSVTTAETTDPSGSTSTTDGPTTENPTTENPTDTQTDSLTVDTLGDSETEDSGDPPACAENPEEQNCEYEYLEGQWYLFCQTQMTWDQAQATCEQLCSHLAVVTSDAQSLALHARLIDPEYVPAVIPENPDVQPLQPDASRWIGARRENGELQWANDQPNPYVYWGPLEPDLNGDCVAVAVVGKEEGDGRWYDRGCSDYNYPFICSYSD